MGNKLTDRDSIGQLQQDFLVHVVDTDDTTQSPEGSSFKATVGQFVELSKDYIDGVTFSGTDLVFTGTGSAFNGSIDLSSLSGGGDSIYEYGTGTFSIQPIEGGNTASGDYSVVSGGAFNTAYSVISTISGGYCNIVSGPGSTIGGGSFNTLTECFNFIGGGFCNSNSTAAYFSIIGGGRYNEIKGSGTFVGGGCSNSACGNYSTISGGRCNTSSGFVSTIGGGLNNISSGDYSAILGGRSNSTNNCADVMIVGSNITADTSCTTFVNKLSIKDIPTSDAGLCTGMVWRDGNDLKIVP